ncbi:hypothetical protein Pelo_19611 [Pelomyxa schiedti]|nr:hypothetical protein Pelo_19611 [Pelomyxa schiedti]
MASQQGAKHLLLTLRNLTRLFEAAMNWGSAPAILWLAELYPEVAGEIIRKRGYTIMDVLCSHSGKYDSGQIAWGLQHTALNAKQVPACLKSLLFHQCYDNAFLLLDRYPDLAQKAQLMTFLGSLIKYGSLRQIQKLLSMCHVLSKSDVSECLTAFPSVDRCVLPTASSKAVKWLVCEANMTAEEVKRNSNALLFRLYYNNNP